jgi:hypothetical protein
MPLTIDLLCAQVYADYIQAQGSAFLRADFSGDDDPAYYICRMLGIDAPAVDGERSRLKLADGQRHRLSATVPAQG